MAVVTVTEMIASEQAALSSGWSEASLMLAAGNALGHAIGRHFPRPGTAITYLGKGHNAGDALIATRILRDAYGWRVACRSAYPREDQAPLVREHRRAFAPADFLTTPPDPTTLLLPLLVIDGLLGTGSKGPLRPPLAGMAAEIERLRTRWGAEVAAVDTPSGIDPDTGRAEVGSIHADVTFMIGNAKRGLLEAHAVNHTGALALVPVAPLALPSTPDLEMICPQIAGYAKAPRPHDLHKGRAGKVGIIAGSDAYSGAAVLAATGALRSGAGLVTLYIPSAIHSLVSGKCPPEIIVRSIHLPSGLPRPDAADAWVVGCGLGTLTDDSADALLAWLSGVEAPTVIDADALNTIACHQRLDLLRANHLLTPHPGEFSRLAPDLSTHPRAQAARCFTDRHPVTLLLKGARSLITARGHPVWCNPTGTHGMASAGMGDLLAGVIGGQLAGGLAPIPSASLAAWLCGRAAERATRSPGLCAESITASDTAHHLGAAIRDWQQAAR